ncbi:MAG: PilZ domain-containing protein [Caulobacteraceae bacterium]
MGFGDTEDKSYENLRKSKRIDYYAKIYCTKYTANGETKDLEKPLELILLNISTVGLGIISETSFEIGTVLVLNIKLEEKNYQKVSARVIWNIKKGDMYRQGLEIINISGKLFTHLGKLDNSITATV